MLGRRFELGFESAAIRVKKWWARIDRRYEQMVESHRLVQNLERTVAGRFVGLVRSTMFWKAEQTRVVAEDKAVLDGKKIQIG
jgi:hypothetical protein